MLAVLLIFIVVLTCLCRFKQQQWRFIFTLPVRIKVVIAPPTLGRFVFGTCIHSFQSGEFSAAIIQLFKSRNYRNDLYTAPCQTGSVDNILAVVGPAIAGFTPAHYVGWRCSFRRGQGRARRPPLPKFPNISRPAWLAAVCIRLHNISNRRGALLRRPSLFYRRGVTTITVPCFRRRSVRFTSLLRTPRVDRATPVPPPPLIRRSRVLGGLMQVQVVNRSLLHYHGPCWVLASELSLCAFRFIFLMNPIRGWLFPSSAIN